MRDDGFSSPRVCVFVSCAQVAFQQPDLERVVCFIRGTRQSYHPVSVRCCAVPVLRMHGEVMMLWRMRDGGFSSPCVRLLYVARRSLGGNQILNMSSVSFAGLDNLQYL